MKETIASFVAVSFVAVFLLVFPAHAGEAGKKIFIEYECISCHSVSAYGMSIVKSENGEEEEDDWGDDGEEAIEPPDLSNVGTKHDKKFLSKYLRKKVDIKGVKHKKRFKGEKAERKELVIWLSTLTKPSTKPVEDKAK